MKILYCIGSLAQKGGTEKVLANKVNYFSERLGYDIHILINDQKNKEFAYNYSNKVNFYDMKISSYLTQPIIPYVSYKILQKKLKNVYRNKISEIKPDIIIVTQHGVEDFIVPKLNLGIPTVREFHFATKAIEETSKLIKGYFNQKVFLLKKRRILKKMNSYDHIVLLTHRDQNYGNYKTNTVVIQNMLSSLDELSILANRSTNIRKHVISVGSMHDKRKGFHIQIRLWEKIIEKHPEWILDIYGDGVERPKLQKLINDLNLNDNVKLHGNTSEIISKYQESDFFLMTSIAEGLPMVILEAMSCGLPCLVFDCPEGPSEIIENDINGYVINNRDENELIEKINTLITNPSLIQKLSANALETSKNYSIETISKKWDDFFKKITVK